MKRKHSGPGWRPEPRGAGSGRLSDSQYETPSSVLTSVLLQTIRLQVINTNNIYQKINSYGCHASSQAHFFLALALVFLAKDKVDTFHRVTRSHTTCQVSETVSIISPRPFEVGQSIRPPLHHRPSSSHVVHLTEDLAAHLIS